MYRSDATVVGRVQRSLRFLESGEIQRVGKTCVRHMYNITLT